mgnify:CR=1 FL=1
MLLRIFQAAFRPEDQQQRGQTVSHQRRTINHRHRRQLRLRRPRPGRAAAGDQSWIPVRGRRLSTWQPLSRSDPDAGGLREQVVSISSRKRGNCLPSQFQSWQTPARFSNTTGSRLTPASLRRGSADARRGSRHPRSPRRRGGRAGPRHPAAIRPDREATRPRRNPPGDQLPHDRRPVPRGRAQGRHGCSPRWSSASQSQ